MSGSLDIKVIQQMLPKSLDASTFVLFRVVLFRVFLRLIVHEIEESIRDEHVFLIQSGSNNVNDHLMELFILIQACKENDARKITVVLPYLPYSKQSKLRTGRGCIATKMLAQIIKKAGADHVIVLDLHAPQIENFFKIPLDNLSIERPLRRWILGAEFDIENLVILATAEDTMRSTSLAKALGSSFGLVQIEKSRIGLGYLNSAYNSIQGDLNKLSLYAPEVRSSRPPSSSQPLGGNAYEESPSDGNDADILSETCSVWVIGDVRGKDVIFLSDVIDRPSREIAIAEHLMDNCRVNSVTCMATHGIFNKPALEMFENCEAISRIVITNSHPFTAVERKSSSKLEIIDIAPLLAEAIRRDYHGDS